MKQNTMAVGLGTNTKKLERASKLALAVAVAGMHVDKRRSSELVQKALGLGGKPSDLVPSSRLREGCMRVSTG